MDVRKEWVSWRRTAGLDPPTSNWNHGEPPKPGRYLVTFPGRDRGRNETNMADWNGYLWRYENGFCPMVVAWKEKPAPWVPVDTQVESD